MEAAAVRAALHGQRADAARERAASSTASSAERLTALADRYVRELEEAPELDLDKLGQALELAEDGKACHDAPHAAPGGGRDVGRADAPD